MQRDHLVRIWRGWVLKGPLQTVRAARLGGRIPRAPVIAALIFAPAIWAATGGVATASAAGNLNWGAGIKATLPADAGTTPGAFLDSVSCASAGNCAAVGSYGGQGLLLTESAGTWATGIKAPLPAEAGTDPNPSLNSVSCASAGNCAAVGAYHDSSYVQQALLLTETSGTWATGINAALPADAGTPAYPALSSVSCGSAGNCAAVGGYFDSSNRSQALLLTETAGTWATGIKAALPADARTNPFAYVGSVSCGSAGNCAAVGTYVDSSNRQQALLLTETAGTWATGIKAALPADAATNPAPSLTSVSCASAGDCAAVGTYVDSSNHQQGLLLTESAGTWTTGVKATLPAGAATSPSPTLNSVSCASAGDCAAVGYYLDSSNSWQALLLTESAGTWASGIKAPLPADAGTSPGGYLKSVSCGSTGNCAAVGTYVDSSNVAQALLLTESAGTWATGIKGTLPADAGISPTPSLYSVSCAAAGDCAAVGWYHDYNSSDDQPSTQGLLLDGAPDTTAPTVSLSSPSDGSSTSDSSPDFAGTAGTAVRDDSTVTIKIWSGSSVGSGDPGYTVSATRDGTTGAYSTSGPYTKVSDSSSHATLPDGTYTAEAFQSDAASNTGHSSGNTFTLDTAKPTSSATSPAATNSSSIQVDYSADGTGSALAKVELYVKGPSDSSYAKAGTDSSPAATGHHFAYSATEGEGDYSFYTRTIDAATNTEDAPDTTDATTRLDTQKPSSSASAPAASNSSSVQVDYTASDNSGGSGLGSVDLYVKGPNDSVYVKVDTDSSPAATGHHFTYTPTEGNGAYSYYTRATDKAGNTEDAPSVPDAATVAVDTQKPTSSASSPTYSKNTSIQVDYTADGTGSALDKVELYVKRPTDSGYNKVDTDSSPAASGHHFTYSASCCDGDYWFYTVAYDKAGNTEDAPANADSVTLRDTQFPAIGCDSADKAWHKQDVSLGCIAFDSGSGVADSNDASFSLQTSVPDGSEDSNAQTGSHQVCDKAGNCATAGPIAGNMIDRKAPGTSDDVPSSTVSHDVTVTLTATDGGSGVDKTYYTTGTAPADPTTGSSVYNPAHKPVLQNGEKIKYFSTDNVGNSEAVRTSAAAHVAQEPSKPSDTTPPSIPATGNVGDHVTCKPGAWTGSPSSFAYSWTIDGSIIAGQHASGYALAAGDATHKIRCEVVAHNAAGDSAPATSNALSVAKPKTACRDTTPAASEIKRWTRANGQLVLRGTAADKPCHGKPGHVVRVFVTISWRRQHGCRFLLENGHGFGPVRSCDGNPPIVFPANGTRRWSLKHSAALPAGRYTIRSRATDASGNTERVKKHGKNVLVLHVK